MNRCSWWISLICGVSLALEPWLYLLGIMETWQMLLWPTVFWIVVGFLSKTWQRSVEPKGSA